jgi:hypothetical protein
MNLKITLEILFGKCFVWILANFETNHQLLADDSALFFGSFSYVRVSALQLEHDRLHTLYVSLLTLISTFDQIFWVRAVDSIVKSSTINALWFIVVVVIFFRVLTLGHLCDCHYGTCLVLVVLKCWVLIRWLRQVVSFLSPPPPQKTVFKFVGIYVSVELYFFFYCY